MAAEGEKIPVVFFPRFTTLVGTDEFESVPIDALGFESFSLSCFRGTQVGASVSDDVKFRLYESPDLVEWTALGSAYDPTAGTIGLYENGDASPRQRYVKATVTQATSSGTDSSCTVWMVGYAQKTVM